MSAQRTAIVFSCDEKYVPLAKGLVLSLADGGVPNADLSLVLIDIGCGPNSLTWMRDRGVEIVPFDPAPIAPAVLAVIKPHQRAQVLRPWLPDLLPAYDQFIWIDSDIWVQSTGFLTLITRMFDALPGRVFIAPGSSHYNATLQSDMANILEMQNNWFRFSYDDADFVAAISRRIHVSTGVFAMARNCPLWGLWAAEVEILYPRIAVREQRLMHLAEQIALNAVIHRTGAFLLLDPLYNFHCNAGGAMRNPANGRVVTNMVMPPREIDVIHLANWSMLGHAYVEQKLLYRGGDYLSAADLAAMLA